MLNNYDEKSSKKVVLVEIICNFAKPIGTEKSYEDLAVFVRRYLKLMKMC